MKYSNKQIENAKRNYNAFLQYTTAKQDVNYSVNPFEAERRAEYHNSIVSKIKEGDKEFEKEWKLFFLKEEVKADQKAADILAPIKGMKKLGEFGKWLNTSGNPYRKQHFNKKYTIEAVNSFLETL